ncbi:hypothetical protein FRACA_1370014 [Frankia canadensis]|uniref:Uncharacterized protein n=1 Tax=Frankia canadensis TaxID=1836972 RepID=A0A2I2KL18_9ACTN|nr:hypothetical protein FRACA_1370014 [Frankia canadensis]SOU53645.1 hypothetical protein FRACA_1370014 [Frankia canadensis]
MRTDRRRHTMRTPTEPRPAPFDDGKNVSRHRSVPTGSHTRLALPSEPPVLQSPTIPHICWAASTQAFRS